jgi:hypothetical protein
MLAIASPAFGQPSPVPLAAPGAIDMTVVLTDESGKPLPDAVGQDFKDDPSCARCPTLTLGHAVAHALFAQLPGETVSGDQKWARGVLADKVRDAKAATLTAEEVVVIKRLIGGLYSGSVVVKAYPLLDPNAQPPKVQ